MANEYIRKQDAVNAINAALKRVFTEHVGEGIINPLKPADVTPVVRCKECKFRENDDFCTGRGFPCQLVPDDGFCDKGERKE